MPTALIVEDEPAANKLLSMLVQLRGYRTDSAFTGVEAIRKADGDHPDVIFLDLMLPDTNGYEVCQTLRDRRATGDIPVVMVTARLAAENRLKGFRAGAIDYIPKPYTPDQIFQAMSLADSWRHRIDDLPDEGIAPLRSTDDVAHLRLASDLHALLLARTDLDEAAAGRVNACLVETLQRGVDWGRKADREQVATVEYRLDRDRLDLTIRDESGWFRHDHPRLNGFAGLLDDAGFREVDLRDGRELRLSVAAPGR